MIRGSEDSATGPFQLDGGRNAGDLSPVLLDLDASLEPVEAFRKLAGLPYVLFLDSAARDPRLGRHSYITAAPFEVLAARENRLWRLESTGGPLSSTSYIPAGESQGDPFSALRERLARLPRTGTSRDDDLPPFHGGAAGLFAYGLSRSIERLPRPRHDEFRTPDLVVGLYDWVIAFDHGSGRSRLVSLGWPAADPGERRRKAELRAREVLEFLERPEETSPRGAKATMTSAPLTRAELAPHWPLREGAELYSDFRREDYIAAVARGIEYIRAGDIFQVNLSQRLLHPLRVSPLDFYLTLRETNPEPFAGYFDLGDTVVASSSPEQFLSVRDGLVVTRPIKGTRSRGYTPEEDTYRRIDLGQSEKDKAENVMIVDLLRNDLSRVCEPGSVQVPRLFEAERHPTVHHLVSEVQGRLRQGHGPLDLLRASFPGGSITGAPKVRAMEIIAELEPTARGAYSGSLGWITPGGDMGTNILIRTVTLSRGWMQIPVGGGIVADSTPEEEYQETLDKAAGMLRAL
ncbi:MAG: aminodeoxychorismate synthase component I [Planctomycetota bacterium]|nr:aminodeoxychorismate synthase component I [Planctomycetota bacterium]